ncbi:hypothetical protein CASFOL_021018 [Castilleja foliolosa]|uniref:Vesicle transport protein n=1 Tax=Castilleja foliolosa TaxID=1961234 RepID=A0ABD3D2H3_9LAMI
MSQNQQDYGSKILYELSSLAFNIIRSPDDNTSAHLRRPSALSFQQITPAGFASLMLGTSLTLMMCGSVTFFIGFVMMPWVLGLVMILYVAGVISSISMIGRAILCCNSASSSSSPPRKGPTYHVSLSLCEGSVIC